MVTKEQANILTDYYNSTEELYTNLNEETFSHERFLGDFYQPIEGVDKSDEKLLTELCKKGKAKSEKISEKLTSLGLILHEKNLYWKELGYLLNYEFSKNVNCKDLLATP